MKRLISTLLVLWGFSLIAFAGRKTFGVPVQFREPDSLAKIEMAKRAGLLDKESALIYKVTAVSDVRKLPVEFQSTTRIKCATPLMKELDAEWPELSPALQSQLKEMWVPCRLIGHETRDAYIGMITNTYPELTKTYYSKKKLAKSHFVIHYTLSGSNAVSGIKYIKRIARVLERSYKWINKVYGKTPKNADGYIHVVMMKMNAWGFCAFLGPAGQTRDAYVALRNTIDTATHPNYKKYGKAMTCGVPAHEYFHAVQFNIDANEGDFMMESSSTWIEGIIYRHNKTYIVDSIVLPYVYQKPMWPIWYTGQDFCYSMMIQRYCQETFNSVTVNKEMWDECAKVNGDNGVAAVGTVLTARGSSWAEAVKGYGSKNYFKRYWDYKRHKKVWPNMTIQGAHNLYGVEPTADSDILQNSGTHYIVLEPPAGLGLKKGGELLVKVKPTQGTPVATLLMEKKKRKFDSFDVPTDSTDANGYYEYMASGFGKKYKRAVLMVQVRDVQKDNFDDHQYTYAAACPQIEVKSFQSSPGMINPGSSSTLKMTFDVKGCWTTMDYPLKFKAHIRGPGKVHDGVSNLTLDAKNGDGQTKDLYFNTGFGCKEGTYKFGIQFVFGTTKKQTSKTNIEWCSVTVKKPPGKSSGTRAYSTTEPSLTLIQP